MEINIKQLLLTYKTITKLMEAEGLTMDNSFRRVQSWLSNRICDSVDESNIIDEDEQNKD